MGCPNFFRYHHDASIEDYAKRFGYDTEVLEKAIKKTEEYSIFKAIHGSNEQVAMREALLKLDTEDETDVLYSKEMNSREVLNYNFNKLFNSNGYASALVKEVVKTVFDFNKAYRAEKSKDPYRLTQYMEFALQEDISYSSSEQLLDVNTANKYRETLYKAITEKFEQMTKNDGDADKEKLLEYLISLVLSYSKNENNECCICGRFLKTDESNLCENCLEFITKLVLEKIDINTVEKLISEFSEMKIMENRRDLDLIFNKSNKI
jgi:hypothetical protein